MSEGEVPVPKKRRLGRIMIALASALVVLLIALWSYFLVPPEPILTSDFYVVPWSLSASMSRELIGKFVDSPESIRRVGDVAVAWLRLTSDEQEPRPEPEARRGAEDAAKALRELSSSLFHLPENPHAGDLWLFRSAPSDGEEPCWITTIQPTRKMWAAWRWYCLTGKWRRGALGVFVRNPGDEAHEIAIAVKQGFIIIGAGKRAENMVERLSRPLNSDAMKHPIPRDPWFPGSTGGLVLFPKKMGLEELSGISRIAAYDEGGKLVIRLSPADPHDPSVYSDAASVNWADAKMTDLTGPPALAQFEFAGPFAKSGLESLGLDLNDAMDQLEGVEWLRPNMAAAIRARLGVVKAPAEADIDAEEASAETSEEMPGEEMPGEPLPEFTEGASEALVTFDPADIPPLGPNSRFGFALLPKHDDAAPAAAVWSYTVTNDPKGVFPAESNDIMELSKSRPTEVNLFGNPLYNEPLDTPRNAAKRRLIADLVAPTSPPRPALGYGVVNFDDLAESARAFPAIVIPKKKRETWRRFVHSLDLLEAAAGSVAVGVYGPDPTSSPADNSLTCEIHWLGDPDKK